MKMKGKFERSKTVTSLILVTLISVFSIVQALTISNIPNNDGYSVSLGISPYSPADKISVLPAEIIYEATEFCTYNETTFSVDIYIHNITDCAAYEFWLYYNSSLLEVTTILIDTDPANPLSPTQIAPSSADRIDIDASVSGIVKYGVAWLPGIPTYSGSGVAARITFKIIYCPPQIVGLLPINNTVSCDLAFDQTETKAYDSMGDDILFAAFNDGYYEYTTIGRVVGTPIADFTWTPSFPYVCDTVTCTDTSTPNGGVIIAWSWSIVGPATWTSPNNMSTRQFHCDGPGTVNVTLTVWDSEGLNDTVTYQIEQIAVALHDIAIIDVAPSKSVVAQGYDITIQVTLKNKGSFTETFTLWTFCGFHENITLPAYSSITIKYTFDTSKLQKGSYRPWAYVLPCFGDENPIDNLYAGDTFLVTIPGDVDGDCDVDVSDQRKVQLAMFSCILPWCTPAEQELYRQYNTPGPPPIFTDLDGDGDVDVGDQRIQQLHMFESC